MASSRNKWVLREDQKERLYAALTASYRTSVSGGLFSDMTLPEVHEAVLRKSLLKKFAYAEAADAEAKALAKFVEYNERCRQFDLSPRALFDEELINGVRCLLDDWLHPDGVPITWETVLTNGYPGKKTSLGCDEIDFYTKLFDSPLTHTNETLRVLYRTYITRNPTWVAAEQARRAQHGCRVVRGSKTSTVPKQNDIRRTICTEPTLNMFFQCGIGVTLRTILLRRLGINLEDQQEVNAELARYGSIDGSFGTIDLASASDSISTRLCEQILPAYFVRMLKLTRSPETVLPDGTVVDLAMISSMGNGFTFPLQTMIFAAVVVTAYNLMGIPYAFRPRFERRTNVGVFGDDIVVDRKVYDYLVAKLPLFGFRVNADKSFNTGHFRESCGKDYWSGTLIRGVYLQSLDTTADCYSAINRLIRYAWRTGCDVSDIVYRFRKEVPLILIPPRDGDGEGIHVPELLSNAYCPLVYHGSLGYRALVRSPVGWSVRGGERRVEVRKRRWVTRPYNWSGLLLTFVAGYLREGRLAALSDDYRFKVLPRSVPFWDYAPWAPGVNPEGESWQAFFLSKFSTLLSRP